MLFLKTQLIYKNDLTLNTKKFKLNHVVFSNSMTKQYRTWIYTGFGTHLTGEQKCNYIFFDSCI